MPQSRQFSPGESPRPPEREQLIRTHMDDVAALLGDPPSQRDVQRAIGYLMNAMSRTTGKWTHVESLFRLQVAVQDLAAAEADRIDERGIAVDWFALAETWANDELSIISVVESWEEISSRPGPVHESSAYR